MNSQHTAVGRGSLPRTDALWEQENLLGNEVSAKIIRKLPNERLGGNLLPEEAKVLLGQDLSHLGDNGGPGGSRSLSEKRFSLRLLLGSKRCTWYTRA